MKVKQKEKRAVARLRRLFSLAEKKVTDEQALELSTLLWKQGEAVVQLVEKQNKGWRERVEDMYCDRASLEGMKGKSESIFK